MQANVKTIWGQQGVSIQLLEQSPIAFDQIVFRDLAKAYAAALDVQVIAGTDTSGQVVGGAGLFRYAYLLGHAHEEARPVAALTASAACLLPWIAGLILIVKGD